MLFKVGGFSRVGLFGTRIYLKRQFSIHDIANSIVVQFYGLCSIVFCQTNNYMFIMVALCFVKLITIFLWWLHCIYLLLLFTYLELFAYLLSLMHINEFISILQNNLPCSVLNFIYMIFKSIFDEIMWNLSYFMLFHTTTHNCYNPS